MAKVFVSGSRGFIGSALKKALEESGDAVIEVPPLLRIQDKTYFSAIPNPEKIDVFYHLSAKSFVPDSWARPSDFFESNVVGTSRVLEFCIEHTIPVVFMSSYIYGAPDYLPLDENHPVKISNPYAMSKKIGEDLCWFYGDNRGLKFNIARPFNTYGPNQPSDFLIPTIIRQLSEPEIKVHDLDPKRDFVYISDVVQALLAMKSKFNNEAYNIASGTSISVAELISSIQSAYGTKRTVTASGQRRHGEIPDCIADISKIKKAFGWEPRVSLSEGLNKIKLRS